MKRIKGFWGSKGGKREIHKKEERNRKSKGSVMFKKRSNADKEEFRV